jgi:hypothetical protein
MFIVPNEEMVVPSIKLDSDIFTMEIDDANVGVQLLLTSFKLSLDIFCRGLVTLSSSSSSDLTSSTSTRIRQTSLFIPLPLILLNWLMILIQWI